MGYKLPLPNTPPRPAESAKMCWIQIGKKKYWQRFVQNQQDMAKNALAKLVYQGKGQDQTQRESSEGGGVSHAYAPLTLALYANG